MKWDWETFPEYLDALERRSRTIDIGTQVPHGALRAFVMGQRGADNEEPTEADIAEMARLVEEGLRAGALGFSTSRTVLHKSIDGELVPGTTATEPELVGIGRAMGKVGHGVFELTTDFLEEWDEFGNRPSSKCRGPSKWQGCATPMTMVPIWSRRLACAVSASS
jgi:N-acyl-D-amino-acid deacylase